MILLSRIIKMYYEHMIVKMIYKYSFISYKSLAFLRLCGTVEVIHTDIHVFKFPDMKNFIAPKSPPITQQTLCRKHYTKHRAIQECLNLHFCSYCQHFPS